MNLKLPAIGLLLLSIATTQAQKKPLSQSVYDSWKQVMKPVVSDNGAYTVYEVTPAKGDGELIIVNNSTFAPQKIERGADATVFGNSGWVTYSIKPTHESMRQANIKKLKGDKLPQSETYISKIEGGSPIKLPAKSKVQTARNAAIAAYTYEVTPTKDSTKKVQAKKFNRLVVLDLTKGDSTIVDNVGKFDISDNGALILLSQETDSLKSVSAMKGGKLTELYTAKQGKIGSLKTDENGTQGAYMVTPDTTAWAQYQLYYVDSKLAKRQLAADGARGYTVSNNGNLSFNKKGTRLMFGMAQPPKAIAKDTLPDDEKAPLDMWSWTDTLLMPQQIASRSQLEKTSYIAVFQPLKNTTALLADKYLSRIQFAADDETPYALGIDNNPYMWSSTWDSPAKTDVYIVDIATGARRLLIKGNTGNGTISPDAKYLLRFDPIEQQYFMMDVATGNIKNVSKSIPYPLADSTNDVPTPDPAYGIAGWTAKDGAVVYDQFDMWLLSYDKEPRRLTNSRGTGIELKYVRLDPEEKTLDLTKDWTLAAFYEPTNDAGFYKLSPTGTLTKLIMSDHKYSTPIKAKDSDRLIFQRENFKEYRDLWVSNTKFENPKKISDANPQASQYLWGSVQHMEWTTMDGETNRGLLYLPENYDPAKKYPTIVYFYETHSRTKNAHLHPQPAWSIIVPVYYTSRDYVVFMPDIKYQTGYPGEGAYNSIVSASRTLIERGISDPARMAIQGQSWGGYQTAYLITRTNMFRAACAGALVSNMTSAFGGIRWGSGSPRMFQYERGQSRIGVSLWENPLLYLENSPLFGAPNVRTPLLMMHNDADDAVPWYQGIEYFLALRRNNVPVWFMNYNGQPHNLRAYAAKMDWDLRMSQFFDYYLKDAPMPRWMKEGIDITEKGHELKFDLLEK